MHDFALHVSANYCSNVESGMEVKKDIEAVPLSLKVIGKKMSESLKGIPYNLRTCHLVNGVLSERILKNFTLFMF